jgi:Flp pilus assembly protein TadD
MNLGNAYQRQGKLDLAERSFRESIRLDPSDSYVHFNLGNLLSRQDRPDEAITSYQEAVRLEPKLFQAHSNLGSALEAVGRLDEAIAAHRRAIEINPRDEKNHVNLGSTLERARRLDEAAAAYRESTRVKPDYAMGHFNLGKVIYRQGRFPEALESLRRGHELGRKTPRWNRPSGEWVGRCERMIEFDRRLTAVLAGTDRPSGDDRLAFAELCAIRHRPAAAAGFYAEVFAARPELADDQWAGHRYTAACVAALAGCRRGEDDPPPDDAARAKWRKQALDWLRAELAARTKLVSAPKSAPTVREVLDDWQRDPDLAGVRDSDGLARLPEEERAAWRQFWAEVDALRARADTQSRAPLNRGT